MCKDVEDVIVKAIASWIESLTQLKCTQTAGAIFVVQTEHSLKYEYNQKMP